MNLYRFIDAQKAVYGTRRLCRVMAVPESSYFDWNSDGRGVAAAKADREQVLVEQIQVFHDASTATYGSPRIHTDLVEGGVVVSRRRVAEVMAANAIAGLSGREHSTVTTRRDRLEAPFPDLSGGGSTRRHRMCAGTATSPTSGSITGDRKSVV